MSKMARSVSPTFRSDPFPIRWSIRAIAPLLLKLRVVWLMLLASLFLSGCVHYDVGINFGGQTQGEIVQVIRLGEPLTSFSDSAAQQWLDSLQQRTRTLGGRAKRISQQEVKVTIPFENGADLEAKFNKFFQPVAPVGKSSGKTTGKTAVKTAGQTSDSALNLPNLESHLRLRESNFLLLLRDRLSYDLDLRSLGFTSSENNLLLNPSGLLELEFSLTTPWGARNLNTAQANATVRQEGKTLIWTLTAGKPNHLEAVFWMPSPLGIGALMIAIAVTAGIYLKKRITPPPTVHTAVPEG